MLDIQTPLTNSDDLHAWILQHLQLNIPRRPVCAEHAAPFEYIQRAYFEPSADQVIWAPRGGGKTTLAAVATLLDLLHKPGISVRILGGSLDQSLKLWESLIPMLESLGHDLIDPKQLKSRKLKLTNGSVCAVLTQSQKSVRGLRVQKLRCDEIELFDDDVWSAAQLTTRSMTDPQMVRGTIEALSTLHKPTGLMSQIIDQSIVNKTPIVRWCLLDVLEHCPESRKCDTCPLWTECKGIAKTACEGYVRIDDAIVMKSRVSLEVWQSEMLCQRPTVRGRVFPMFDPALHVRDTNPFDEDMSFAQWWLGVDFGFSNPFACLWIAKFGEEIYVVDEYIQESKTIYEHIAEIKARNWPHAERIACDPAGSCRNDQTARSNVDVLRQEGFRVKYRGSRIVDGVEMIRAALRSADGQTRLFIHPRCLRLIRALQSYRYPDMATEQPFKDGTHDHPMDALRYFFINQSASSPMKSRGY